MSNPNDLKFLEYFPKLNGWLMLNGFSLLYSIASPEMNVIISAWSDQRTGNDKPGPAIGEDASVLVLLYNNYSKAVEVYVNGLVDLKGSDAEVAGMLKDYNRTGRARSGGATRSAPVTNAWLFP